MMARLPTVVTTEQAQRGDGTKPDCFTGVHLQDTGVVSSLSVHEQEFERISDENHVSLLFGAKLNMSACVCPITAFLLALILQ
jgi:hypothetical protein